MQKAPKSIALIREGKLPPDRRVALSPDQCVRFQETFPNCRLMVQSSPIRCFSDGFAARVQQFWLLRMVRRRLH